MNLLQLIFSCLFIYISTINGDSNNKRVNAFGEYPSKSTLKVFGTCLSKTATTSLASFFESLGLKVLHYDLRASPFLPHYNFSFHGLYDSVDAVFDIPTAFYYKDLMNEYPQALFISVYREPEAWFRSVSRYLLTKQHITSNTDAFFQTMMHKIIYGSEQPQHDIWINNYKKYYDSVRVAIPRDKLLNLSIENINSDSICKFINIPLVSCPRFPKVNIGIDPNIKPIELYLNKTKDIWSFRKQSALHAYATVIGMMTLTLLCIPFVITNVGFANFEKNVEQNDEVAAAIGLCGSIRASYDSNDLSYDVIALLYNNIVEDDILRLYSCFDR